MLVRNQTCHPDWSASGTEGSSTAMITRVRAKHGTFSDFEDLSTSPEYRLRSR